MSKSRLSNQRSGLEGFTDALVSMVAVSTGSMLLLATIAIVTTTPLSVDLCDLEGIVDDDGIVRLERLDGVLDGEERFNVRVMALNQGVVWSYGGGEVQKDVNCRPVLVVIDGRALPGRVISWGERNE